MTTVLLDTWVDWACPNCLVTERTRPVPPNAARMHDCAGLHGLTAPLVQAGTDCKVIAVERGDYLRDSEQRTGDNGKPYMAVETHRGDGSNDTYAFAEVAVMKGR